jgi:hypothetical protein
MLSHHHCPQYNRSLILVLDRTIMGLLSFFSFFGILFGITWFSAFFMFSPSLYVPLFPIWSFCSLVPCSPSLYIPLFPIWSSCSLVPPAYMFPCSPYDFFVPLFPSLYVPLFPIDDLFVPYCKTCLVSVIPRNPRNTLLNIYIVFEISIHKKD